MLLRPSLMDHACRPICWILTAYTELHNSSIAFGGDGRDPQADDGRKDLTLVAARAMIEAIGY